jgi:hypothetical protein
MEKKYAEMSQYWKDTGEKHGNYKLLQCRVCLWAFQHAEEQNITVDEATANQRHQKIIGGLNVFIKLRRD